MRQRRVAAVVAIRCLLLAIALVLLETAVAQGDGSAGLSPASKGWRLLATQAHPDDELVWAGTLARLKATLEDALTVSLLSASTWTGSTPEKRETQLNCSAGALGVDALLQPRLRAQDFSRMLDVAAPGEDEAWRRMRSKLIPLIFTIPPRSSSHESKFDCPLFDLEARIARRMRELQPQVVLTWEPGGATNHPEHIIVSHATTAAFFASGDPAYPIKEVAPYQPQKLYYFGVFPLFNPADAAFDLLKSWEQREVLRRAEMGIGMPPITLSVDVSKYLDKKQQATRCYLRPGATTLPDRLTVLRTGPNEAKEHFYLAASTARTTRGSEESFFDGIVGRSNR